MASSKKYAAIVAFVSLLVSSTSGWLLPTSVLAQTSDTSVEFFAAPGSYEDEVTFDSTIGSITVESREPIEILSNTSLYTNYVFYTEMTFGDGDVPITSITLETDLTLGPYLKVYGEDMNGRRETLYKSFKSGTTTFDLIDEGFATVNKIEWKGRGVTLVELRTGSASEEPPVEEPPPPPPPPPPEEEEPPVEEPPPPPPPPPPEEEEPPVEEPPPPPPPPPPEEEEPPVEEPPPPPPPPPPEEEEPPVEEPPQPPPPPASGEIQFDFGGAAEGESLSSLGSNAGTFSKTGNIKAHYIDGQPYAQAFQVQQNEGGHGSIVFPEEVDLLVNKAHIVPGLIMQTEVSVSGQTAAGEYVTLAREYIGVPGEEEMTLTWYIPDDVVRIHAISWSHPWPSAFVAVPDTGSIGKLTLLESRENQSPNTAHEPWNNFPSGKEFGCGNDEAHHLERLEQDRLNFIRRLPSPYLVRTDTRTLEHILSQRHKDLTVEAINAAVAQYRKEYEEAHGTRELETDAQEFERALLQQRTEKLAEIKRDIDNNNYNRGIWAKEASQYIAEYPDDLDTAKNEFFNLFYETHRHAGLGFKTPGQGNIKKLGPNDYWRVAVSNAEVTTAYNEAIDRARGETGQDPSLECGDHGDGGGTPPTPPPPPEEEEPPMEEEPPIEEEPPVEEQPVEEGDFTDEDIAVLEEVLSLLYEEYAYAPTTEIASTGGGQLDPDATLATLIEDAESAALELTNRINDIISNERLPEFEEIGQKLISVMKLIVEKGVRESAQNLPNANNLSKGLGSYYSALLRDGSKLAKETRVAGAIIGYVNDVDEYLTDLYEAWEDDPEDFLEDELHKITDDFAVSSASKGVLLAAGPVGKILVIFNVDEILENEAYLIRDCFFRVMWEVIFEDELKSTSFCRAYSL